MDQKFILKVAATGEITREGFNEENPLDQLQRAVGGYIERVPVPMVRGNDLFVNEDGIALKLPINEKLTRFVQKRIRSTIVTILGDGVFAAHDGEGNTIGLTEAQCADIEKAIALANK